MNRDFVNDYMKEKDIPTGNLKVWYNFASGATTGGAGLFYNQVHSISDHYYDTSNNDGDLKSGVMAGISIGDHDVISTPGLFDHREMIQISDKVDYNNWTIFFDITTSSQQNLTGQQKILLSSMKNSGDTSGFHIGLNGYNHPFITYASKDGAKYTHTFSGEASDRSLFSFSFNNDGKSLSIEKHSPLEDYAQSFVTENLKLSNTWTIGGFKEYLNSAEPATDIRSFNGTMNHFMIFSPSLKGKLINNFSDFLFIKSYEKPQIKQRELITQKNISGTYITSGVIGTGITGYEKSLSSTINGIPIYKNVGVTGEISGDVIAYSDEMEDVVTYEKYLSNEVKTFDDSISKKFFNKKLSFLKPIESGYSLPESGSLYVDSNKDSIDRISYAAYEVSSSEKVNTNTQKIARWNGVSGAFILQSGLDNKYINLFRNGLLQRSGTLEEVEKTDTDGTGFADYTLLNSRFIYSNNRYQDDDYILYEECDSPNIIGGYVKGEQSSYMYWNGSQYVHDTWYFFKSKSDFIKKDLYFGGLKLISGVDYAVADGFSSLISVYTSGLNNGVFSWIEKFSSNEHNTETGNLTYNLNLNYELMDEIVWLSGIRQRKNVDYIKTADFSVLNSGYKFNKNTNNNHIIYSGDTGFFNV